MTAAVTTTEMLPLPPAPSTHRWFSSWGVVVEDGERRNVYVGGTLLGSFGPRERAMRNAILMGLCTDPRIHLGKVSRAFGLSSEAVRQMRRLFEREGLEAVIARKPGGSEATKVTKAVRRRLETMFDAGLTVAQAQQKLRSKLGYSTIGFVRTEWALARRAAAAPVAPSETPAPSAAESSTLPLVAVQQPTEAPVEPQERAAETTVEEATEAAAEPEMTVPRRAGSEDVAGSDAQAIAPRSPRAVEGGRWVQHLGAWLLVAMLARDGLYRHADAVRGDRVKAHELRIAMDAVVIALAIGQRCVEGIRRLATPSSATLLCAARPPSASWVRRILGRFAKEHGGSRIHLATAKEIISLEGQKKERVVFYIDNHLRPYTGQHTIRKGWRMQEKRVLPGTTDYYVHDEDGRPVLRIAVPSHDSLTDWLPRIARVLREALGEKVTILLGFDRGGAFPEHLKELREDNFEFVTYERRPFAALKPSEFKQTIEDGDESIGVADRWTNLGQGRGRVRRIALRMPDDRQINLLAISALEPADLYAIMRGRWCQENGFKHGVERWGINQLDGRTVIACPPDAIIPNPARRRLDRALRIARVREGNARRELAKLTKGDPRRSKWSHEIDDALAEQQQLEALRPTTPKHAPVEETELKDKLVQHPDEYKIVLDTIRIACANAESELATMLAKHMSRPAEAKRALANLFAAPGAVHLRHNTITVTLQPAGTHSELCAFAAFLRECRGLDLALPGDQAGRRLRFELQLS